MIVYLAATSYMKKHFDDGTIDPSKLSALESFYTIKNWQVPLIPKLKNFLLDSGAFSFMTSVKNTDEIDWMEYAARYADFVRKNNIERYIELDIDGIVGLPRVEEIRKFIENRVGWPSIPVWHIPRGKDKFIEICKSHPYVAIGGLVSKDTAVSIDTFFPWFIKTAHQNGAKIHGLGYTKLTQLHKYHFDSVDSTSWLSSARYGSIYEFDKKTNRLIIHDPKEGGIKVKNIKSVKEAQLYTFNSWRRFQDYAEVNL